MTRTCKQLFLPLFLLQAAFFCFVSQHRLIDVDEGFYLLGSRLVLEHRTPYLDFFYTQAPLLLYVYALWFKLTTISWFSARLFSALLTAVLGGLIYYHVCRETGRWMAGLAAVVLFASSSLVFAWLPIVKTFALATLFLFLAYLALVRLVPSSPGWRWALSGFAFGLSVDTRSYVIAVAPVFLWWIWRNRSRGIAHLLWFLAGLFAGLVPSLALFFASPDVYLFNNLGYHAMRSGSGLIGDWRNKALITRLLFTSADTGFQFSVLSVACVAGFILLWRRPRDASLLAFVIALALGLVSLLPTPASLQYFSMIMPFVIVAAACLGSDYLGRLQSARARRVAWAACSFLLAGYLAFASFNLEHYLFSGRDVPGVKGEDDAPNWTLQQVTAVSLALDRSVVPGEKVASFWPGFIFASWADPYPGFENNFGLWVARDLTPDQRRKYHVIFDREIDAAFARHGPRVAVVGNQGLFSGGPEYSACVKMLHGHGYTLAKLVGETSIYECCEKLR